MYNENGIELRNTDGYKKAYGAEFEKKMSDVGRRVAQQEIKVQEDSYLADAELRKTETELRTSIARFAKETKIANEKDAFFRQKKKMKLRDTMPTYARKLTIISFLFACISAFMSVSCVSHMYKPSELLHVYESNYVWAAVVMFGAQMVAFILSVGAYRFRLYFKRLYPFVTAMRLIIAFFSIWSNHGYLCAIIPEYTTSNYYFVGWFFAVFADAASFILSAYGNKMHYLLYDNNVTDDVDELGFFEMLIDNLTFKVKLSVRQKWIDNEQIRLELEGKKPKGNTENIGKKYKTAKNTKVVNLANTSVSTKTTEEFCEKYRGTIIGIPEGREVNKNTFGVSRSDWRRIRDYYCKEGLLSCEGRGKPVVRTSCAA